MAWSWSPAALWDSMATLATSSLACAPCTTSQSRATAGNEDPVHMYKLAGAVPQATSQVNMLVCLKAAAKACMRVTIALGQLFLHRIECRWDECLCTCNRI